MLESVKGCENVVNEIRRIVERHDGGVTIHGRPGHEPNKIRSRELAHSVRTKLCNECTRHVKRNFVLVIKGKILSQLLSIFSSRFKWI